MPPENDVRREMTPPCPAPTQILMLDALETDATAIDLVKNGAVSIGNFDGVHAGHRELLARTRANADAVGGPAVVVVLDPHPASVLRPHSAPARLTTIRRRAELMSELGIDALVVCPVTLDFLNRTAEEFFDFLIVKRLQAKTMVEGPNFFFGRDRGGDVHVLRTLCEQTGMQLEVVHPRIEGGRLVSSSRIREAISAGEIESANAMLQSKYQIAGRVTSGERRGRLIGFPTANLTDIETLVPENGVYAAKVAVGKRSPASIGTDSSELLLAAVHVGPNPTFDAEQRTKVEVHCLDYDGDLYGQCLTVEWNARVRPVQKFSGADALTAQLRRDVESVRKLLH
ncbi:bifunctional riboflavin kinase/FAD synthetase [Aporhodopirellula aestuarii]|uniref:Riboflavin biosynthesis protein n=1 Tax=Aporhodopirellula aestuarii TaxID=2950107 RepID=A0ABT0UCJ9_9BACT|nr:bifunctional riboflavin kinase/FAD synthetase [Aporhodopirellula aestuarii]MCM2374537.1 bifunctional riboflavin kinase/FAD synthetase [Aporhodopirellula aestuarii]